MGRRAVHHPDTLLDAALTLAGQGGPAAVTMSAVARTAGASSGSVYYRFPDRAALLSALWLRTVDRFQAGLMEVLGTGTPADGVAAAARHVVDWSRRHPAEAHLLLAGADVLGTGEWSEADRRTLAARNSAPAAAFAGLATELGLDVEQVVLLVVDLPYATVRRHLSGGHEIPTVAADAVASAARTLVREWTAR